MKGVAVLDDGDNSVTVVIWMYVCMHARTSPCSRSSCGASWPHSLTHSLARESKKEHIGRTNSNRPTVCDRD